MTEKRERTKYTGIYARTSTTRRNPRDGKADVCYEITYKTPERRKIWEKVGWKSEGYTAQMASELRGDRVKALRHGTSVRSQRVITLNEAWEIFKEQWLPNLARPKDEEGRYKRYLAPVLGDKPLDRITPLDLEGIKTSLLTKYAPATVALVFADIRRVYNKMIEWELYLGSNPTAKVKAPKVDNARTRFLTVDEAHRLLSALAERSMVWHDLAAISLQTGMRLGEILALRGADIDLQHGMAYALDAKAGTRAVLISDAIKPVFERRIPSSPAGYLFTTRTGSPLKNATSSMYRRIVDDIGLNAGIIDPRQKVVFHTLRHTYCSWLVIKGVPLYTVGELVGHNSIEMTKRYAHLCPDAKRDALRHIAETLNAGHTSSPS